MRLTVEEHPEAIKRYGHVGAARGRSVKCAGTCPGSVRACTRARGHRGPHVSHGRFGRLLAVWDSGVGVGTPLGSRRGSGAGPRRGARKGHPIGLRTRWPAGPLEALRDRFLRVLRSPDQLLFLVLLLAFAGFAVHWLLLIFGLY